MTLTFDVASINVYDSNRYTIKLKFRNFIMVREEEVEIPYEDISSTIIKRILKSHGSICSKEEAKNIANVVEKTIERILREGKHFDFLNRFHSQIGWQRNEVGALVFNGYFQVGEDNYQSTYSGSLNIKPTSSKEDPMNNVLFHMLGSSTTGKTTALQMFVGLGCSPERVCGYLLSYLASQGAIIKAIGNNNGYPVGIDEYSTTDSKKYLTLLYIRSEMESKKTV